MSEVTENNGLPALTAGNTVNTLASTDRDVVAGSSTPVEEFTASASTVEAPNSTESEESEESAESVEEFLDEENTFDVNRAEFSELRDLVLSIAEGIKQFNTGAPHKIPTISINQVLGIK